MSDDPHSPTTAAPTPEPTPTVSGSEAMRSRPAGSAAPGGTGDELPFGIPADRPEILVGAAFAGGLVAGLILKRLGGH